MRAVVDQYLDWICAGDIDAVVALFAADAVVEDPAGAEERTGAAIRRFYTDAFAGGAVAKLTGPVRLTERHAAFPFRAEITRDGKVTTIEVIDVFAFDDTGKIARMTAYFGPQNMMVRDL